jgi:hypothetical protein
MPELPVLAGFAITPLNRRSAADATCAVAPLQEAASIGLRKRAGS